MAKITYKPDPKLDLTLERIIDVPPALVWMAWTKPEHLKKWFTPEPWKTVDCEIDLRPGGMFRTVIQSPEGENFPGMGCYLEIIENERLTWTDAMGPGFRPATKPNMCTDSYFTAVLTLEPHEGGTRYSVLAIHSDEEGRKRHEERGFHDGWGKALEQLITYVKSVK